VGLDNETFREDDLAALAAVLENSFDVTYFDVTYPDDMPTLKTALDSDEAPQWQEALKSESTP
jgi:hypothetical protein